MTATTSAPVSYPDRFFIGGEWVAPSSDATIDVIDSGTEELFFRVAEARADDMSRAVGAARAAFDEGPWPAHDPRRAGRDTSAPSVPRSMERSDGDRPSCGRGSRARIAPGGAVRGDDVRRRHRVLRGARRHLPVRGARAAVDGRRVRAAGPRAGRRGRRDHPVERAARSSSRTRSARRCSPAARSCSSLARGARRGLPGRRGGGADRAPARRPQRRDRRPRGVGAARRAIPRVDKITFTGSTAAGRRIASLCGERIARCTLELGGKSAAVILDDADIATVAASHRRRRVHHDRPGVLVAHADRRHPSAATTSWSRRWPRTSPRCRSATRSTQQTQMGPLAMQPPARPRRGLHRQGHRRGRDARHRRRPPEGPRPRAGSSSRPCSATSTTRRPSPRRRSSDRCSA